jgi:hypothetical protein
MHLWVTFLLLLEGYAFTRRTEINTMAVLAYQKHRKEQKKNLEHSKYCIHTHFGCTEITIIFLITCSRKEGCSPPSPEDNFVT